MSPRPDLALQGYSDPINHALAFAAKYHDQQVRRGLRGPYVTQPANVAVILTRYGCDDTTVIAGILFDMIEDGLTQAQSWQMLEQRVVDKFGPEVFAVAQGAAQRRTSDGAVEMTSDERREDALQRLASAGDASRWVCAATTLHRAATLLADLRRTVDRAAVWSRATGGRQATTGWYRRIIRRLRAVEFHASIVDELDDVVTALEGLPA
jgi:(p)ppGpp synthase/HD superfamily hydrolase